MKKLKFRVFPNGWQKNIRPQSVTYEQYKSAILCGFIIGIDFRKQFEQLYSLKRTKALQGAEVEKLPAIANAYLFNIGTTELVNDIQFDGQQNEYNGEIFLEFNIECNPCLDDNAVYNEKIKEIIQWKSTAALFNGVLRNSFFVLIFTNAQTNLERKRVAKQLYADIYGRFGLLATHNCCNIFWKTPLSFDPDAYFNDAPEIVIGRWQQEPSFEYLDGLLQQKPFVAITETEERRRIENLLFDKTSLESGEENLTSTFNPKIYRYLPTYLYQKTSIYQNPRQKDIALLSLIVAISSILINVEVFQTKWQSTNLFLLVIAPPGSYKSTITIGLKAISAIDDNIYRESLAAKREYEIRKREDELEPYEEEPPLVRLLYPMNASAAALIKRLSDVQVGALLHTTEIYSFLKNAGDSWSAMEDVFCKAFHNETHGALRLDYEVTLENLRLSILCSGTPEQALQFLPSTSNGLVSRFIFYFNDTPSKWNHTAFDSEDQYPQLPPDIDDILLELYKYLASGTTRRFSWIEQRHKDLLNKMHEEWLNNTREMTSNNDNDPTIFRNALMVTRIACILTVLRLYEKNKKNVEAFDEIIPENFTASDIDLQIALEITKTLLQEHSMHFYEMMEVKSPEKTKGKRSNAMRLYDFVSDEFFRKDILKEAMAFLNVQERSIGNYLDKLVSVNLLRRGDKDGQYFKIKSK